MGQASNKRKQLLSYQAPVAQVAQGLKKLAIAASGALGMDCYLTAVLGQKVLEDFGIHAEIAVGHAAWRVGPGDSDVIAHVPSGNQYVPPGEIGLAYHAWLELPSLGTLVDFTTYQLPLKAEQLDQYDGGATRVDWAPSYLFVQRSTCKTYGEVAAAAGPVAYFYQSVPEARELLAKSFVLDPADLAAARLVCRNPDINVVGPQSL